MRAWLLGIFVVSACGRGTAQVPPPPTTTTTTTPIDRAAMVERVRAEMRMAWSAYVRHAWGHDELRPVTHAARDWYGGSLLITPVDALDTLVMMGLGDEAKAARALIDERLSFDQDITV